MKSSTVPVSLVFASMLVLAAAGCPTDGPGTVDTGTGGGGGDAVTGDDDGGGGGDVDDAGGDDGGVVDTGGSDVEDGGETDDETGVDDAGDTDDGPEDTEDGGAMDGTATDGGSTDGGAEDVTDGESTDVSGETGTDATTDASEDAGDTGDTSDAGQPTTGWRMVSSYQSRNCAVDNDDKVCCWDDSGGNSGELSEPSGNYTDVVAEGSYTNCALEQSTGYPHCWGDNIDLVGLDQTPQTEFVDLGMAAFAVCGVRASDGQLECWGDSAKQSEVPSTQFRTIVGGFTAFCGVKVSDGTIECFEWSGSSTLSDWSGEQPVPDGQFEEIDFGSQHACGINAAGGIDCWGDETTPESAMDDKSSTGTGYVAVAAGQSWSCGARPTGGVECWGSDQHGVVSGAPSSGAFVDLSGHSGPGGKHACGVKQNGDIVCWGGKNLQGSIDPTVPPTTADCPNGAGQ